MRQLPGYGRFDHPAAVPLLIDLYIHSWGRLHNLFRPSVKLVDKQRIGSRIHKTYDMPQTPCQRLLSCPQVSAESKATLRAEIARLDPFGLKKEIEQ